MHEYLLWIAGVALFLLSLCDITELLLNRIRSLIGRFKEDRVKRD